jgi:hypothetical protein
MYCVLNKVVCRLSTEVAQELFWSFKITTNTKSPYTFVLRGRDLLLVSKRFPSNG